MGLFNSWFAVAIAAIMSACLGASGDPESGATTTESAIQVAASVYACNPNPQAPVFPRGVGQFGNPGTAPRSSIPSMALDEAISDGSHWGNGE